MGELEDDDDDEDDELDDEDDDDEESEEVEILLSFEHRGKEFNLVRLLDPVLLVGKADPENDDEENLVDAGGIARGHARAGRHVFGVS